MSPIDYYLNNASSALETLSEEILLGAYATLPPEEQKKVRVKLFRLIGDTKALWGHYLDYPKEPKQTLYRIEKRRKEGKKL